MHRKAHLCGKHAFAPLQDDKAPLERLLMTERRAPVCRLTLSDSACAHKCTTALNSYVVIICAHLANFYRMSIQ